MSAFTYMQSVIPTFRVLHICTCSRPLLDGPLPLVSINLTMCKVPQPTAVSSQNLAHQGFVSSQESIAQYTSLTWDFPLQEARLQAERSSGKADSAPANGKKDSKQAVDKPAAAGSDSSKGAHSNGDAKPGDDAMQE